MANLVSRDMQSPTGTNLKLVKSSSRLSAWEASQVKLKEAIREKETVSVEEIDFWRIPCLDKLLSRRQEMTYMGEDIEEISSHINSLCIN